MHPMGHMAFVSMETLALQSCDGDEPLLALLVGRMSQSKADPASPWAQSIGFDRPSLSRSFLKCSNSSDFLALLSGLKAMIPVKHWMEGT